MANILHVVRQLFASLYKGLMNAESLSKWGRIGGKVAEIIIVIGT
jgi:hypothetical protein